MHATAVGESYLPNGGPIQERVEYNFRSGGHELLMSLANLSQKEVQAITQGSAEFALFVQGDMMLFLYRFGDAVPWSDAPYSWHLVPSEQRTLPSEISAAEGVLLSIVLVEATTGIVKGIRVVSFSPEFSSSLHQAMPPRAACPLGIALQALRPFPPDYDEQLTAIYQRYQKSELLSTKAIARTSTPSSRSNKGFGK